MNCFLQEQLCNFIMYLIEHFPRLQDLFQRWTDLNDEQKKYVNEDVLKTIGSESTFYYEPIREALTRWDYIQDTQGAVGSLPGAYNYHCTPAVKKLLHRYVNILEMSLFNLYFGNTEIPENIKQPHVQFLGVMEPQNNKLPRSLSVNDLRGDGVNRIRNAEKKIKRFGKKFVNLKRTDPKFKYESD